MDAGMVNSRNREERLIDAEAAVWLTRLQDPGRKIETERAFRAWLDTSENRRAAFERANDIWEMLPASMNPPEYFTDHSAFRVRRVLPLAAPSILVAFALIWIGFPLSPTVQPAQYKTAIGQQKEVVLSDGTRLSLNTESSVTVSYSVGLREIWVNQGEVLIAAHKDPGRPLQVTSDDKQIRVIGTKFLVRRETERLFVTLLEGHVELFRVVKEQPVALAVMRPGQRITLNRGSSPIVDYPDPKAATAWRNGKIVFDNVTLVEAINEFNRYTKSKVRIDPAASHFRISGVFSIHEPVEFGMAVGELLDLTVKRSGEDILLLRKKSEG